jgi:branched-chain amino acid transport system substrate-binding protein
VDGFGRGFRHGDSPEWFPFIIPAGPAASSRPKLAQLAGPAAEGAISGAAWFIGAETPGNQDFIRAYKARYGSDPDQFAAQAYAGAHIFATAIKNAGSADPQAIRDAMARIKDLDTVLGKFSFDVNRNPVYEPVLQVVKDGKFALYK